MTIYDNDFTTRHYDDYWEMIKHEAFIAIPATVFGLFILDMLSRHVLGYSVVRTIFDVALEGWRLFFGCN